MLTKDQVLDAVRSGERDTNCWLDRRDFARLADFFEPEHWPAFGLKVKEGVDLSTCSVKPWTREEVCRQILADARFGLDKAEDERGISSGLMAGVLTTWSWIMEDPSLDGSDVSGYGVRFFREAVERYEHLAREMLRS